MRKTFLTILLFLFSLGKLCAQEKIIEEQMQVDTVITSVQNDYQNTEEDEEEEYVKKYENFGKEVQGDTSISFNEFQLKDDSIKSWKNQKQYSWIKTIENDLKENLEEEEKTNQDNYRKGRNINEGLSKADNAFNSGIFKLIMWVLAALFIGFLVYQLFLSKGNLGKLPKAKTVEVIDEEVIDENYMNKDFDKLQKAAFYNGDTRLAMRYLFLKMLQKLQRRNHIQFAADKTNSDYSNEIPQQYRDNFSALAMYFEYVWYGKLDIEKDVFAKIELQYEKFLNQI